MGDRLEPGDVTEILRTDPTTAYRKGEVYRRDRNTHQIARGRTGLWLLSSKGHVQSSDLNDHLRYLLEVLFYTGDSSDRVARLGEMPRDGHIEADVNCFWYGRPGTPQPTIPEDVVSAFNRLPAHIETDFQVDRE